MSMERELARLEDQLRRSLEGGAWHGPAVLEALEGVTPSQARAHPLKGAHSIWELVLHLTGAYSLVLRRLHGDARPLTPEEDWPPVREPAEEQEEHWQAALGTLKRLNEEVRRAILRFPAERLGQALVEEPAYSAYVQLIGLTQHDAYHAGQIVLLRRALSAVPAA